MITTVLLSTDDALAELLAEAAGPQLVVLGHVAGLDSVLADGAQVVVLDARPDPTAALALTSRLGLEHPGVSTVLIGPDDAATAVAALRAGARDLLPAQAPVVDVRAALARAVASSPAGAVLPTGRPRGRVISVVSPKGGVGKTTVASNLAVGLALRESGSVVLVDLDVQFGDVASALDLEPVHHLPDVVTGPAREDPVALKALLTRHPTGLHVVCAPDSPADADGVSEADVAHLLHGLAQEFRYVVVDTAPGLSEHTLAALDATTDLILLTSMDVPGVRGLRKEIDTLARLDLLPVSRQVVLNFAQSRGMLGVADVEFTIGTKVDVQLPRSKAAPDSVDQGVPLLQSGVRDPMTRQLRALLDALVGAAPGAKEVRAVAPGRARRAASRWRRTRPAVA